MDRRTITALLLVGVVILLTPRLFPGKSRLLPIRAKTDTALTANSPVRTTEAPDPSIPAAVVAVTRLPNTTQQTQAADIQVAGKLAEFSFRGADASLMAVRLDGFKNLSAKDGSPAQLMTPSRSLLQLQLINGNDTIALNDAHFAVTRSRISAETEEVNFRGHLRGAAIVLKYTIKPDSFLIEVSGTIGRSDSLNNARYVLVGLPGTFRSFEADSIDDHRNLAYAYKPAGGNARSIKFSSLDPGERNLEKGPFDWVVAKNKYFLVGILAAEHDSLLAEISAVGGPRTGRDATEAIGSVLARIEQGAFGFKVYAGPQQWRRLVAMGRDFENANPYGGFLQGFVQPFATIVMKILLWMRENLKFSYGWVLVIFGITVRIALWPLNQKGMRASMRMQRIQPELNEIQKRYKGDPPKLQSEMMRVYKEHNMSPFSTFTGCLPLFLPLPILFALFYVFQNTIEFRGVPFLWFPDISQKDPFYIVPLTMGLSMFGLSWIGMRNMPPNPQTKMMTYILPVMMTFLFANFPSGLNLYYTIQNLAALPQQWLIGNERAKTGATGKS
jgi:YidC/Oxa1 family membrane protein insertase